MRSGTALKQKKLGLSRGIYNNAGQLLFTPISYRLIINYNLLEHISTLAQTCLKLLLSIVECVNSLKNRKVRPLVGISFLD